MKLDYSCKPLLVAKIKIKINLLSRGVGSITRDPDSLIETKSIIETKTKVQINPKSGWVSYKKPNKINNSLKPGQVIDQSTNNSQQTAELPEHNI